MNRNEHRRRFLELLFDGLPGRIEVRALPCRRQHFCETIAEALAAVDRECAAGENVYVGIATRGELVSMDTGRTSGGKDNLVATRGWWIDRDGLTTQEARSKYEAELKAFRMAPTLRVDSGGGEHDYWLTEEPISLTTPEAIARFEQTLRGFAALLGGDSAATDASRILRVPGTYNRKRGAAHVRIVESAGCVYAEREADEIATHGAARAPVPAAETPEGKSRFTEGYRHEALKRHAAFLRKSALSPEAVRAALRIYNAERCAPPVEEEEVERLARWAKRVRAGENNAREVEPEAPPTLEEDPLAWKRSVLTTEGASLDLEEILWDEGDEGLAPRWPSSLEDAPFYGVTVVAGQAGVGKSVLAIASSLEAAGTGRWKVLYVNGELDAREMRVRVRTYYRAMPNPPHPGRFVVVTLPPAGASLGAIAARCAREVDERTRMLVVLDSVNSISEACAPAGYPGASLDELRRHIAWATQVRKVTLGEISFLLVSELNARAEVKGLKANYSADVVAKLEAVDGAPEFVDVRITKGRTSGRKDLGRFRVDWRSWRFAR